MDKKHDDKHVPGNETTTASSQSPLIGQSNHVGNNEPVGGSTNSGIQSTQGLVTNARDPINYAEIFQYSGHAAAGGDPSKPSWQAPHTAGPQKKD